MNSVRLKPRRPLRYELYSLASVLAIPVALCFIFPVEAIGFRAAPDPAVGAPASCAFVVLTEEEAARAVSDARAAWRVDAAGVRRLRVDLSVVTMPEEPHGAVMKATERERIPPPRILSPTTEPLPPTRAAERPEKISAPDDSSDDGFAFPRKDLLKLD